MTHPSHRLVVAAIVGTLLSPHALADSDGSYAPGFDGERAFEDLRSLVALGPRASGSPGAERTRELIRSRLRQAGWPSREQRFEARPPNHAPVPMVNLVAELPGPEPLWIVFGTHYDTKRVEGIRFVGANDGASGVALLLELARQLVPASRPYGVRLLFFDGEEPFGPHLTLEDGLYGSRALSREMKLAGQLDSVAALVVVDMVADRDLDLVDDRNSSAGLRSLLLRAAQRLELESLLREGPRTAIFDDHVPFKREGLDRVLCLIDLRYGDRSLPGPFWHSSRDDLDAVSSSSLNRVGRLVVELYGLLLLELREGRLP